MVFPESSRPEAMIRGEEKLIGSDELYNEIIHIFGIFKKFPKKGKFILTRVVVILLLNRVLLKVDFE